MSGTFALSPDGSAMTGTGSEGGATFTWNGARKR